MKAKDARRALRERDRIEKQAKEAEATSFEKNRAEAEARDAAENMEASLRIGYHVRDEILKSLRDIQAHYEAAEKDVVSRRVLLVEKRDQAERAEAEAEQARRVAAGLAAKLKDERFVEAEKTLVRVAERKAEEGKPAAPLTEEAKAGLQLLRRAFDPRGIRRPSHRVVHDYAEGGSGTEDEFEDVEEPEDTSVPCPDCGAAVGAPCDESKPHRESGESEAAFQKRAAEFRARGAMKK